MQPNEQPQHPIDYLDSIATAPKGAGSKAGDKLFFIVIIAAVVVTLLVAAFLFLNKGPDSGDDLARLSTRMKNLQSVTDSSRKNIVSSQLRATNTSLALVFTNANRDITKELTAHGVDPEKMNPQLTTQEKTDELTKKLEDARLNAAFDRTYAREMSYQLETLLILIEQTEAKTKSSSTKEYLSTTHQNLEPLQKQLAEFSAS